MYRLAVSRTFVAQHFLTVPSPPPGEGEPHSHTYEVEAELRAAELGEYGYVVDIDAVEATLDDLVADYRDTLLNDRPAFDGNPSVERFARLFGDRLVETVDDDTLAGVDGLTVRMWEDDVARVAHDRDL
ncbi:6-pyruvoyl tetrahydropterin synthase family protein [Halobaculum sp. MBLA0143]|uniref:6-pyruvoyl trahydropterin synthase family protein n=1 Tax=Halobaculum sp. MBLA0143 TaxID=3079933 RepID=UPI0035240C53